MKRIAVQNDLHDVRKELEDRGYEVVDFYEKGVVDAIVYIDDHSGLQNLNNVKDTDNYGAILINANNRTVDEIQFIIESRRYGSLFN
ncbi:MAG: YkuS family protein [Clostridiaceae bacterium]|nr:YkuS family protein [Clostridiaceae bacterium]